MANNLNNYGYLYKPQWQNFTGGVSGVILWNDPDVFKDTSSFWSASKPSGLSIPNGMGGKYLADASLGIVFPASTISRVTFRFTQVDANSNIKKEASVHTDISSITRLIQLQSSLGVVDTFDGDFFYCTVFYPSGPASGVIDMTSSWGSTFMSIYRL